MEAKFINYMDQNIYLIVYLYDGDYIDIQHISANIHLTKG